MNLEQYEEWEKFRESSSNTLQKNEINLVATLHAQIYNHKIHKPCTCNPKTWVQWIDDINKHYKTIEKPTE
jgi:hypothetical protein